MEGPKARHGIVLNRASMVIAATVNGQGIGLARSTLAAWDLVNGRLVAPFTASLPLTTACWIVAPQATAALPRIATVRGGMLAEADEDRRQLGSIDVRGPADRP